MTPLGPALHPELSALEFLVGNWIGTGAGTYPGSQPFDFEEELTFSHEGKPVLAYQMRTSRMGGDTPSHAERGFWKCRDSLNIDTVVSHATGHVEVSEGSVVATTVILQSTAVVGWRGSKEVLAISRRLSFDDDVLNDALAMQAVGQELQAHVSAELRRR